MKRHLTTIALATLIVAAPSAAANAIVPEIPTTSHAVVQAQAVQPVTTGAFSAPSAVKSASAASASTTSDGFWDAVVDFLRDIIEFIADTFLGGLPDDQPDQPSKPTPAPAPAPNPEPAPQPVPEPTPSPEPAPQPVPEPAPKPEPAPQPSKPSHPAPGLDARLTAVLDAVNAERAKGGLAALQLDPCLNVHGAQSWAESMAATGNFNHQDMNKVMQACPAAGAVGENIAMGQRTAEDVMAAWLKSPGHRQNIMRTSYKTIGLGVAADSQGRLYWVQNFGMGSVSSADASRH